MEKKEVISNEVVAAISLNRLYYCVNKIKADLTSNKRINKQEVLGLLNSIEHDIILLTDENTVVNNDLF